jgi:hypothetical protein
MKPRIIPRDMQGFSFLRGIPARSEGYCCGHPNQSRICPNDSQKLSVRSICQGDLSNEARRSETKRFPSLKRTSGVECDANDSRIIVSGRPFFARPVTFDASVAKLRGRHGLISLAGNTLPARIVPHTFTSRIFSMGTANGSSSRITKSAHFPGSMLPNLSSTPKV